MAEVRKLGSKVAAFSQVAGLGSPGVDCLLCANGRFVAVEFKRSSQYKPTPRQAATLAKVREAGGLTFVVYDTKSVLECVEHLSSL